MNGPDWSRRSFLKVGALTGGGLLVGVQWSCAPGRARDGGDPVILGAHFRIRPDGRVSILAPKVEMGQGTRTSLPMILADELGVPWSRVQVEPAPLDEETFGWQGVGGSTSIWNLWEPLRIAGATAREMLGSAAAARWEVPASECSVVDGRVMHEGSGRSVDIGEVAADAALLDVPDSPRLKPRSEHRLIGTPTPQVDLPDIVSGRVQYGLDTRVEGMLRVCIERGPFGSEPMSIDDAAARAIPGVVDVVRLERSAHRGILAEGVAVLATNTWTAMQGRNALRVEWSESPEPPTAELAADLARRVREPLPELRNDGSFDDAVARGARVIEADYHVPFLAHAPMEPGNCYAHVHEGGVDVRGPFQDPEEARVWASQIAGVEPERVTVHPVRVGGGFGRRLTSDYAAEAVALATATGHPLQVVWTREDDIGHDFYRPLAAHRLTAVLDEDGSLIGWRNRQASTSRYGYRGSPEPWASEFYPDDPPARMVPAYRIEYQAVDSVIPRGTWRSVVHSGNGFVVESFLDEVAHADGRDPLAFRLDLYGEDRELPYEDHGGPVLDTGRLRAVLERAAEGANWSSGPAPGRGLGLAAHFTFGSYAAQVAEVSVDDDGRIRVHRVVAAIDCGIPVNPLGIEAQVEGGVIYGLSAVLGEEVTFVGGRAQQSNFHDYPVLRMPDAPEIEVHIVDSGAAPKGTGETSVPPVAPAVANAVFAAAGIRLRNPPFTPEKVLAAREGAT